MTFSLQRRLRPAIATLQPYASARDEYSGAEGIFLDANENPFGTWNRYPDPLQRELKNTIATLKNVPVERIFLGNGSDEVIDIILRMFCAPSVDKILICPPTYGMYQVSAAISDVGVISAPLQDDFQLDISLLQNIIKNDTAETIKVIFFCSPNNPTGNILTGIEEILREFQGVVVVDEAYIDFSTHPSFSEKLDLYPNLIVSQTLSKAWGAASARIGMAFASPDIIRVMNTIKPPYNIGNPNAQAALNILGDTEGFRERKKSILSERERMVQALDKLMLVKQIFPSEANFLLVKVDNATEIYNKLIQKKIIVRNRHSVAENCLRITIGTPQENTALLQALQEIQA